MTTTMMMMMIDDDEDNNHYDDNNDDDDNAHNVRETLHNSLCREFSLQLLCAILFVV
jgi:hypothetical protein